MTLFKGQLKIAKYFFHSLGNDLVICKAALLKGVLASLTLHSNAFHV